MEKIFGLFSEKPISMIEKEDFFKKGFRYLFLFIAAVLVIMGIISIIGGAINYFDFFSNLTAWQIIRSLLLFAICLIITILSIAFMAGILWKRSKTMLEESNNIVDLVPRILKTFGEVIAVLPISTGIIALFTAIFAVIPFFPILNMAESFIPINMMQLQSGLGVSGFVAYFEQLAMFGIAPLCLGIIFSFLNIALMYLLAELFKLIVAFLRK